jgi:surfactin synthase thioesterase subunit
VAGDHFYVTTMVGELVGDIEQRIAQL